MFSPLAFLFVSLIPQSNQAISDFDSQRTPGLNSMQIAEGWLALFDGRTLFGWRHKSPWNVVEGAIEGSQKTDLLRTAVQFDDFRLRLEYRPDGNGRCGVLIRTPPDPKNPRTDHYRINISPNDSRSKPGSIAGYAEADPVPVRNGWQELVVEAVGSSIGVWINGKPASTIHSDNIRLRKGYIGFQIESGKIRFRNVSVKPLGMESILAGNKLDDWNQRETRKTKFELAQSVLTMRNGPGQLESKQSFGDFVFSTHVRTNAEGLNSGIFFRCIPGQFMNGYESQIQNQFKNNDRRKPVDCGTGGIFRRQNARVVNSDDMHWFAKTIVADGATIGVWVNGLQVADWSDGRKPNANPRKGRRLEPGTIILQGHDPTTDVSFKEMKVRELNHRR